MPQSSIIPTPTTRREAWGHFDTVIVRMSTARITALLLGQPAPNFQHTGTTGRQHAVLHTIQIAAVDRGHEFARDQTQNDARREVVPS